MNDPHWEHLIHGHLDESLTEPERAEFETLMLESASARQRFWELAEVHGLARETARTVFGEDADRHTANVILMKRTTRVWLQWRPLAAAAAGLLIGLLCASVAWAVASPRAVATMERLFALANGSFEKMAGKVPSGFPVQTGVWSGDESEVVTREAREGRRMLRFVKAEADANDPGGCAISCDVFQLVDLRALHARAAARDDSVLELSAEFLDARAANTNPSVTFICQMFLFRGDPAAMSAAWPQAIHEAVSSGSAEITTLGGGIWRKVTARCLAPADADFAVVQIAARPNLRVPMPPQLFADDVKLTLKTQPALPVRVVQR